ncbi:hypothetical protein Q2397_26095, partial [Escherichia coli]|nr:hypothetical protein [Escherichia coli]
GLGVVKKKQPQERLLSSLHFCEIPPLFTRFSRRRVKQPPVAEEKGGLVRSGTPKAAKKNTPRL